MRTSKKERKKNAVVFYNLFMNSNCNQAAVVVNRLPSSNPNMCRCQFLAVPSTLAFMEKPVVIAESTLGIEGCFMELIGFIYGGVQKKYYEDGFNEWLDKTCGFRITYKDGLVFMFEKKGKK